MRVVVVTGQGAHHRHLCAQLAGAFEVVGIIHPAEARMSAGRRLRRIFRQAKSEGWPLLAMHLLGKIGAQAAPGDFSEGAAAYDRIPRSLIHPGLEVRAEATHQFLRSLRPDVTLCLGGPVYPQALIDASPITLNFHSGISPIYNGTASIQFAFAHGHPHLCGGTLMAMGAEVDGGRILGHYLPRIESGDTPDKLFAETVRGAAMIYQRVLQHIDTGGSLQSVPQPPPLFYTRGVELGWHHRRMIARNVRQDLPARYRRAEETAEYWSKPTPEAAREACHSKLAQLLWGST